MLKFFSFLFVILICFNLHENPRAETSSLGKITNIKEKIELRIGKSKLIQLRKKPKRMVLSNPGVAYVLMVSKDEVEIIGRNPGITNLYVWLQPEDSKKEKEELVGLEIAVSLPAPNYINSQAEQSVELFYGGDSDLVLLGYPKEVISNSSPARLSPMESDMPEPCLSPGCI